MLKQRIIPSLLLKDGRMVKGKNFADFRDVGDPVAAAKVYNAQKVDELMFLDIRPTAQSRAKVRRIIEAAACECFMPLTVGGGVRTVGDVRYLLTIGADKVAINSAAVRTPELIRDAAELFGDQCVVVSVDYRLDAAGRRSVWIDSATTDSGLDPLEHVKRCVALGAGEILLTSIDQEGTLAGYDFEFLDEVARAVGVPVIAAGGAGRLEDFFRALTTTKVSAVSAASIFHFTDQSPIKARFFLSNSGVNVRV
jgi:cyclase